MIAGTGGGASSIPRGARRRCGLPARAAVASAALAVCCGAACADLPSSGDALADARPRCGAYQPVSESEAARGQAFFSEMLSGMVADGARLREDWARLGYELTERTGKPRWWVLRETQPGCRGQGYYLIRQRTPVLLAVQVPHAFADLHTGGIADGMLDGPADVIAWNTAPRQTQVDGGGGSADLARRTDSLFAALTRSLGRDHPDARIVQIHGFANERRKTAAGSRAAVIVSSGSRWVTSGVDTVARCLARFIDGPVAVFPRDVTELGATTNLHGKILRRLGHEGFVHVEMNLPTRRRLLAEDAWQGRFSACLEKR